MKRTALLALSFGLAVGTLQHLSAQDVPRRHYCCMATGVAIMGFGVWGAVVCRTADDVLGTCVSAGGIVAVGGLCLAGILADIYFARGRQRAQRPTAHDGESTPIAPGAQRPPVYGTSEQSSSGNGGDIPGSPRDGDDDSPV